MKDRLRTIALAMAGIVLMLSVLAAVGGLEIEVTGRFDGYLTEIRVDGREWWISPDQIMRVALTEAEHPQRQP
jgi:hypothetical protein